MFLRFIYMRLLCFLTIILTSITSMCQITDSSEFHFDNENTFLLEPKKAANMDTSTIRFDKRHINLLGKWCYVNEDSSCWTISKVEDGSLVYSCSGILFESHGKATQHFQGDYFQKPPTIKYEILDTLLILSMYKMDSLISTEKYFVESFFANKIIFKRSKESLILPITQQDSTKYLMVYPFHSAFKDTNFVPGKFGIGSHNSLPYFKNQSGDSTKKKLEDKVNIGDEPRGNKVFGTDSTKATLTIFKKRNRSNTKTLSINRIVGLKTDSVYFRGQVTSFTDSVIAFHSYYRNGIMHDSAYVFTLKYIQQIKYCRAKNINKYLEKHVKQDKHLPQAPLYVLFGIGTSALIANAIGNLDNAFNENTDRAFNLISVYSYGLGFLYGACTIFPSAIKLRFFNMTTKWTFSSSNTITD